MNESVQSRVLTRVGLLALLLAYAIPFSLVILASMKSNSAIVNDPASIIFRPTVSAYRAILNGRLAHAMINSLEIATGTAVVTMGLGAPFAYALSRYSAKWTGLFIGILVALQMMPNAVSAIPLYGILAKLGLLGSTAGVVLAISATTLPFAALLLRPYFLSVPQEIHEAAEVDGAGQLRTFIQVVLPVVRNGMLLIGALTFMWAWGEFLYCVSFLNSGDKYPLSILLAQQQTYYGTKWNDLMALSLVGAVPSLVLFAFVGRHLRSGLTLGVGK